MSTRYIDVEIVDPAGALVALQEQAKANSPGCWFRVDPDDVASAKTLVDALCAWRWGSFEAQNGSVCVDEFFGERLGDDLVLFRALAPFVKAGGCLRLLDPEGGEQWRWVFDGQTCHEQHATITWPDLPAAKGK